MCSQSLAKPVSKKSPCMASQLSLLTLTVNCLPNQMYRVLSDIYIDVVVVLLNVYIHIYILVMHYRSQATRQPRQFTYDPVPIPHMLSQSGRINWFQLYCEIKRGIEAR